MSAIKLPIWFWVISIIALLWNLAGLSAFAMDMSMSSEQLAALPEDIRNLYLHRPIWATIGYALATIGGTLGCIALLLKKSWARPLFLFSLIGIVLQNIWALFMSNAIELIGLSAAIMPLLVIIIALLLLWFSRQSIAKGWIR